MSSFLKENWIFKLIKTECKPQYLNCQIVEVKELDDKVEFIVSDSKHYINAEITKRSIASFSNELDITYPEMKGAFITIDEYKPIEVNGRISIVVDKFTYLGNETSICGSPQDSSVLYTKESFLFEESYFKQINSLLRKESSTVKDLFKKMNRNNWFMENIFTEQFEN